MSQKLSEQRHTYDEWRAKGYYVRRGERHCARRGDLFLFRFSQVEPIEVKDKKTGKKVKSEGFLEADGHYDDRSLEEMNAPEQERFYGDLE